MRRRWQIAGVLLATVLAGCGDRPAAPATPMLGASAGSHQLVAAARTGPAYSRADTGLLGAPAVAVYADGVVVAAAGYRARLSDAALRELVGALITDLGGQPPSPAPAGDVHVMDGGTAILTVRLADGRLHEVAAPALTVLRDRDAYPAALYDAWDRLQRVAAEARTGGQPYHADRVRLAVMPWTGPSGTITDWPGGVALPTGTVPGTELRVADLSGGDARAVTAALPADPDSAAPWPVYRVPGGGTVAASWRYLLPDE